MNLSSIHVIQENLTSIREPYVNIGPIHKCNTNQGFTSATRIELRFPLATGIDLGFIDRTGIGEKEKQYMFPYKEQIDILVGYIIHFLHISIPTHVHDQSLYVGLIRVIRTFLFLTNREHTLLFFFSDSRTVNESEIYSRC